MTLSTGFPEGRNGPLAAGQDQIAPAPGHPVQNALLAGLGQADVRPGSETVGGRPALKLSSE